MKKPLRVLLFMTFGLGNLLLLLSRTFNDNLTDFGLGFLEGISIVFILTGTIYLFRCAVKGENPLKEGK